MEPVPSSPNPDRYTGKGFDVTKHNHQGHMDQLSPD